MNNQPFSSRHLIPVFAAFIILTFAVIACGAVMASPTSSAPSMTDVASIPTMLAPTPTAPLIYPTGIVSTPAPVDTPLPAIPERRRLTLEFPAQIREGDSDVIRLTLEVDDLGNIVPTAQIGGNVVAGEMVEIPNLYETHNVIAEAKFDVAGLEISPSDVISQPLSKGQSVTFIWSVRPKEVGIYRGTIWFYLRFVDKVSGEESQKTVSAQLVEIEAVNFMGLPANVVRTVGGLGSILGAVVGFPFFEDIVRYLFKRKKKRRK